MATLSRMELAALKRMEKSLKPLEKQMAVLDHKLSGLLDERNRVQNQFDKMVEVMNTYTGGIPYQEILHPATIDDEIEEEVDDIETVEKDDPPHKMVEETVEEFA